MEVNNNNNNNNPGNAKKAKITAAPVVASPAGNADGNVEMPDAKGGRRKHKGKKTCRNKNKTVEGGKRKKTRRASKGASDWNKKVMMVYHELKRKNPLTKLGAAMKEASRRKKQGKL